MMTPEQLRTLPKTEFHRHLDGSVRVRTLWELLEPEYRNGLFADLSGLKKHYVIADPAPLGPLLSRFELHQKIFCSRANIKRVAFENVEDMYHDGVVLGELRFAPCFMQEGHTISYDECIASVLDGVQEGLNKFPGIRAGLIIIGVRGQSVRKTTDALSEALRIRKTHPSGHLLTGFDLAGTEADSDLKAYLALVNQAREAGLKITIHTGEDSSADTMWQALELFKPERVGHGIAAATDPELCSFLKKSKIHLEISCYSNYLTQTVRRLQDHPIRDFYNQGISCSVNTDDPHIMGTSLIREYSLLQKLFGFSRDDFQKINLSAIDHSFLSETDKNFARDKLTDHNY